jgi:hypothetical protein
MQANLSSLRIGIYGPEEPVTSESRGCALWATGYAAVLKEVGVTPVPLGETRAGRSWDALLGEVQGLVWTSPPRTSAQATTEDERLCAWCRKHQLPLLAVDYALHALNAVYGGTLYLNLATEFPEALQHRHPPEPGLRHAIEVTNGSRLAEIYGEGELVVNSEHRRAVHKVASGFRVAAKALDGVIEAIEAENPNWFAVGVQWRPASATASGLDIQLFRGLVEAIQQPTAPKRSRAVCAAA